MGLAKQKTSSNLTPEQQARATAHNWRAVEALRLGKRERVGQKLAYYFQPTSAGYWDDVWQEHFTKDRFSAAEAGSLGDFERAFLSHLPTKGRILEAGCGLGNLVLSLCRRGFDCEGVDFGDATIEAVSKLYPELKLEVGDVTDLVTVPDQHYRAYISIGVVEHRLEGPEPFLAEALRVLDDRGVAIFTTPHFHLLRRIKCALGFYRSSLPDLTFYQYAYTKKALQGDLEKAGFEVVDGYNHNAVKGLSDELPFFKTIVESNSFSKSLKPFVKSNLILNHLFGHSVLLVCRKSDALADLKADTPLSKVLYRYFTKFDKLAGSGFTKKQLGGFLANRNITGDEQGIIIPTSLIHSTIIPLGAKLITLGKADFSNVPLFGLKVIESDGQVSVLRKLDDIETASVDKRFRAKLEKAWQTGKVSPSARGLLRKRRVAGQVSWFLPRPANFDTEARPSEKEIAAAEKGSLGEFREALVEHLNKKRAVVAKGMLSKALTKKGYNCEPEEKADAYICLEYSSTPLEEIITEADESLRKGGKLFLALWRQSPLNLTQSSNPALFESLFRVEYSESLQLEGFKIIERRRAGVIDGLRETLLRPLVNRLPSRFKKLVEQSSMLQYFFASRMLLVAKKIS